MYETRLHGKEAYECKHDCPRTFAQSPGNRGHNQYLGLFSHCTQSIPRHHNRDKNKIKIRNSKRGFSSRSCLHGITNPKIWKYFTYYKQCQETRTLKENFTWELKLKIVLHQLKIMHRTLFLKRCSWQSNTKSQKDYNVIYWLIRDKMLIENDNYKRRHDSVTS